MEALQGVFLNGIVIKPHNVPGATEQFIKVTAKVDQRPFNVEAVISVNVETGQSADGFCQAFIQNGCDYKALLMDHDVQWVATSMHPAFQLQAGFEFEETTDGIYRAVIREKASNDQFTETVLDFVEHIQAMVEFGFNAEVINGLYLGAEPAEAVENLDSIYLEEFLSVKNLMTTPDVEVITTKLRSATTIYSSFVIQGRPYSVYPGKPLSDYVAISVDAVLNVDYQTKKIGIRRISGHFAQVYSFDESTGQYTDLPFDEWIENLGWSVRDNPLLSYLTAYEKIAELFESEQVSNALRDYYF